MRRALALALTLLAAACAQSKAPVAPLQTVGPAIPPRPGMPVPHLIDIGGALHAMEAICEPEANCPPETIAISAARCLPIAPEDGQLSAACRVDWSKGEGLDRKDHRGECIRFILLDVEGAEGGKLWAVRYTPPGHRCEVPTG